MDEVQLAGRQIVAVVDDDRGVLESLQDLLESAGYEAQVFSSAKAFLGSGNVHAIDCLISDISMPEMDGWALQRHVTVQRPDLPIILITAHPEQASSTAGRCGGRAPQLFMKPFDGQLLLRAIRRLLEQA